MKSRPVSGPYGRANDMSKLPVILGAIALIGFLASWATGSIHADNAVEEAGVGIAAQIDTVDLMSKSKGLPVETAGAI